MHRYGFLLAIVLGIVGLLVSLIATSSKSPDGSHDLSVMIASISGILLGAGLGAWFDGIKNPRERLSVLSAILALGLLYIVIATVPQIQSPEIERWLDVYFAAGAAVAGAALSVVLARLRK